MQILNNKRVHAYLIELVYHIHSVGILVVMQQGVNRYQHFHAVHMCIAHYFRYVLHTVSCRLASTVRWRTDIHGICAGLYSRLGYFFIFRRT